jgi:DNA-binding SARP family transcriptional activator/predicted negative regulator of RcsB-dependent stress response
VSIEFKVLGPLEVVVDGVPLSIPSGRARSLLATLLLRPNRVVSVDELVDRLWDGSPPNPARVKPTLHMVVTRLRQSLGRADRVRTSVDGYLVAVEPGELDLERFRALREADRFPEALALWRGTPLSNVSSDSLHRDEVVELLEERLEVLEARIEADLETGNLPGLVVELRSLTRDHPLRERFWAQLMLALYRSDQQSEALLAYGAVSRLLGEELGVDPGPRLREVHRKILAGDGDVEKPTRAIPRQLPAHTPNFVGRAAEMARLDELMAASSTGQTLVISAIDGSGGIGKTALAVRWAHQVADRFPDGQLYVDLRGFDPSAAPVSSAEVVSWFLDALDVPRERIPHSVDAQYALYRSLLADRRVLVLLDNARDAEQVRELLPGTPTCLVVITSRNRLTGLVVREGARLVTLDLLGRADAEALLAQQLGARRMAAEPAAVSVLVDRCGGLPLALAIVAARAAASSVSQLAEFVAELEDEHARLDAFDTDDALTSVRAVFSWSYDRLPPSAARLFRLLGMNPGPDISLRAAAHLADCSPDECSRVLEELVGAHLISKIGPDRFAFHDLVRDYAKELVHRHDGETERRAALNRLLDFYLHTAGNAAKVTSAYHHENLHTEPEGSYSIVFAECGPALAWCDGELANLVAAARATEDYDGHRYARLQSINLFAYFDVRKRYSEWIELLEIAIRSAKRFQDPIAAMSLQGVASAYLEVGRAPDAIAAVTGALEIRVETGNRRGEAASLQMLGLIQTRLGDFDAAIARLHAAREILVEIGHYEYEAVVLNSLANVYLALNDYALATDMCLEALKLIAANDNLVFECRFLDTLGQAYAGSGDHVNAIATYEKSVEKAGIARDHSTEGIALHNLASLFADIGDVDRAEATWKRSLAILEELGHSNAEMVRDRLGGLSKRGTVRARHVVADSSTTDDQVRG